MQILELDNNYYWQVLSLIRNTDEKLSWSDKQIFECFDKNNIIYAIQLRNQLIAVAIFSTILDTSELLYICVDKNYQNKKIAHQLLTGSISKLKIKSIKEIFLEVSINNSSAISLYTKIGFEYISLRKNYYRYKDGNYSDGLVYRLHI